MTNDQFRITQAHIGCSNKWLADMFDVSPETISRWRLDRPISGPVAIAMIALASGWRP
jgi:hypothetical protein